ncbi:DUF5801 repeats-in-toxin domain-containing protein [Novosphingobium sp. ZN18A2]|uniref:DUF5801 repeats-in-toxin domain-containing protein n=1 Tax=Novosphingobium sp. ZN18A2 TaxID=3079861 RepID=UPI0030CF8FD6
MDFQEGRQSGSNGTNASADNTAAEHTAAASNAPAASNAVELVPNADNVVVLPEGASLDDLTVQGRDIVITLPDGQVYVIHDGAVYVPQIVVDNVEIPPLNLAALLTGNGPQPAAGAAQSSGGNFAEAAGPIQSAYGLGDLLPYTNLSFSEPQQREVLPYLADNNVPDVVIQDGSPASSNAVDNVSEAGLPADRLNGNVESPGSSAGDGSDSTTGTIFITSPDGIGSITINGVTVTGVAGQEIDTGTGSLVLGALENGQIGYTYTLYDNTSGDNASDVFSVVVTDTDGDKANATLTINIADDVPTAHADSGSAGEGATLNVNAASGVLSNDVLGADGAAPGGAVTGVVAGSDTSAAVTGGIDTAIAGSYGTLTLHADGSYSYASTANGVPAGGASDTFVYTITDGDGDTSTTTLTINLTDSGLAATGEDASVNEAALDGIGSNPSSNAETVSGTLVDNASGGSGALSYALVGSGTGSHGSITVNPDGTWSYTLTSPVDGTTLDNGTNTVDNVESFTYQVTDANGNTTTNTITIDVIDDVPTARADSDSVVEGGTTDGNVVSGVGTTSGLVDVLGADGAAPGGAVTGVVAGSDTSAAVTGGIDTAIAGSYGTLTLHADGSYSYASTANGVPAGGASDTFVYTITDGDGDTSTTTLTINLSDSGLAPDNQTVTVYEAALDTIVDPNDLAASAVTGSNPTLTTETVTGQLNANSAPTYVATSGTTAYGSYQVNADGTFTYTLTSPYTTTPSADNGAETEAGKDSFSYTAKDANGNTVSGTITVDIVDDVPSIDVTAGSDSGVVLTTHDALTVGAAFDTASSTANFGSVFGLTSTAGADGAATPSLSYAFTIDNAASGLTSHGDAITLYQLADGTVVGSTAGTAPASVSDASVVFSVSVASDGTVTLTQFQQIDHSAAADPSPTDAPFVDQTTVLADGHLSLTASSTITDSDGDSATDSASIDLGHNLVFADAGPSLSATAAGVGVTVDETTAGSPGGFGVSGISATSATAAITATSDFGADGPATSGSSVYGLTVNGTGTTALHTTVGDYAIHLDQTSSSTISGIYNDGASDHTAFTLTINADGTLTLTQFVALDHPVTTDPNDPLHLTDASGASLVDATLTITDYDGDTATTSVGIGQNVTFLDDGPSIDVTAGADSGVVLTTHDALTVGAAFDTAMSTANFGSVFGLTSTAGADGAATPSLSYAFTIDNAASGLTSHGDAITLYQLADGTVVGSTAGTAPASVSDASVVFSVSVAGDGTVTLTQFQQIDHSAAADPSPTDAPFADQTTVLADGHLSLTASSTITDSDGDSATDSASIDLGHNLVFADAGPSLSATAAGVGVTVDETTAGSPGGFGVSGISATSATAAITATSDFGADGPATSGSSVYGLTVNGTGTTALHTTVGDYAIHLDQTSSSTISGVYNDGASDHTAFTLTINADGTLTLTQFVALDHPVTTDPNDPLHLTDASGASLVDATLTITDYDGDTATTSVGIGQNVTFLDDGPSIDVTAGADSGVVLTTHDALTVGAAFDTAMSTANFGSVFGLTSTAGADGAATPSLSYAFTIDNAASGLTSHGDAITLYQLADGTVVGSTAGTAPASVSDASVVFSVSVAGDGTVTLTQFQQIDHSAAADPSPTDAPFADQTTVLADGHLSLTASSTITDSDGDSATDSASIDLGHNLVFADAGPSLSATAAGVGVTVDETTAGSPGGFGVSGISATSATAAITATSDFGADGPATSGSSVYGLTVNGTGTTALHTTVGDYAIHLDQTSSSTISGIYNDGASDHTAFTLTINADGTLTLTQFVALDHPVTTDPNDPLHLTDGSGASLVDATLTITDYDGDTATTSVGIGQNVTFLDDGPSIDVTAGADSGVVLTTHDALTVGAAFDTASSTANFGSVFGLTSTAGADGAATPSLSYAFTIDNAASGLTSHGDAITLYQLADGTVVGSTAGTAPASVSDASVVFSVSVAGDGTVTLTQFQQIDHSAAADPSPTDAPFADQTTVLADGHLSLTASSTITDSDGDSATDSASIDLGHNLVFADAGPSLSATAAGVGVTVDETTAGSPGGFGVSGISATSATAAITATSDFGADGPATSGSSVYGLTVNGTGTTALHTTVGDYAIHLDQTSSSTISGIYNDGASDHTAFTLTINADGTLTLTQFVALDHPVTTDPNDPLHLTDGSGASLVDATLTITDYDGDTATTSVGIGQNVTFLDDGSSAATADGVSLTNGSGGTNSAFLDADHTLSNNYGADGPGAVIFTAATITSLEGQNLTSGFAALEYALSADGTVLTASKSTDHSLVFTIALQPSGSPDQYVVTMAQPVDSTSTVNFNDGTYDFVGGNDPWAGFVPLGQDPNKPGGVALNDNSHDLLLTPFGTDGTSGDSINGTANSAGVSGGGGGQNIGTDEGIRLDFVVDLTGNPKGSPANYDGNVAQQDHVFDNHYQVNDVSVQFGSGSTNTTIGIEAFDANDSTDLVYHNGTQVNVTQVVISYDGENQLFSFDPAHLTQTLSVGSPGGLADRNYTVTWVESSPGSGVYSVEVTGVLDTSVRIATHGASAYEALEIQHISGDSFALTGFGAATISNDPVDFNVPISIQDGDGDIVPSGSLPIHLNATTTPIAMDLDHNGVQYLGLAAGVMFDYNHDGVAEHTAWVAGNDGILAHQGADGSLQIAFSSAGAGTDLQGLAATYDTNGDAQLTSADKAFGSFGVWQDANSNGVVDSGEFHTLAELGISSISLKSDGVTSVQAGGDVVVSGSSTFVMNGTAATLDDAAFATVAAERTAARTAELAAVSVAAAGFAGLAAAHAAMAMPVAAESSNVPVATLQLADIADHAVLPDVVSTTKAPVEHFEAQQAEQAPTPERHAMQDSSTLEPLHDLGTVADHANPLPAVQAAVGGADLHVSSLFGNAGDASLMQSILQAAHSNGANAQAEQQQAQGTMDLPAVREAMAEGTASHAVDAIVDHFAAGHSAPAITMPDGGAGDMLAHALAGSGHPAMNPGIMEAEMAHALAAAEAHAVVHA